MNRCIDLQACHPTRYREQFVVSEAKQQYAFGYAWHYGSQQLTQPIVGWQCQITVAIAMCDFRIKTTT
jgi:hypothetical protein